MELDITFKKIGSPPKYAFKCDVMKEDFYLGQGQYGKVFKGFALDHDQKVVKSVAVKIIEKNPREQTEREETQKTADAERSAYDILKDLTKTSKNLLPTYEIIEDQDYLFIIMKYCRLGDLRKQLLKQKNFTENEAIILLTQILQGLKVLHEKLIIHRDLKPGNILIDDDGNYLICDFGQSTICEKMTHTLATLSLQGTLNYVAPEILKEEKYNSSIDIFSTGVLIYEAIFKQVPWPAKSIYQQIKSYEQNLVIKFPDIPVVSQQLKNLLKKMCSHDHENRPIINEVLNDIDYLQLTQRAHGEMFEIQNEKNLLLQFVRLFNYKAIFNRNIQESMTTCQGITNKSDKPYVKQICSYPIQPKQKKQVKEQNGLKIDLAFLKDPKLFIEIAVQIQQNLLIDENIQNQFDSIVQNYNFEYQKAQLAIYVIEGLIKANQEFKKNQQLLVTTLIYVLGKYQVLCVENLRRKLFAYENVFGFNQQLFLRFVQSNQFEKFNTDIYFHSQLSKFIFQFIHEDYQEKIKDLSGKLDEQFQQEFNKLNNKDIKDPEQMKSAKFLIKSLTRQIIDLSKADIFKPKGFNNWKLIPCYFLVQLMLHLEVRKFNINTYQTFGKIISDANAYGQENLQKNLMKKYEELISKQII